ncbi:MAG: type polyketide synthase [Cyanobacteria bacterium RYN_339]|nr:type polyketide synthase [Cyanobacteria bacterium RYN_339]
MSFGPIAIIGMSCRFPGCPSPEALWANVLDRRDLVAEGLTRLPCEDDPVFAWALEGAREAVSRAGPRLGRGGLVMGNMFLPTRELVRWAEHVRRDGPAADPRSRFSTGLPALEVARALGLEAGGFALDAACATSLYALKLACDRLHDGEADWMLAGAVSHADATILDRSLGSVGVLSPTNRSRPFHSEADGMVWSEGAAFVVLRRLDAALADGDEILAVIRGIGVNNSGQARGLLAPSERAQVEAMRSAYDMAGLAPADVPLVECHATGNPLGDLIELRALKRLFPPGLAIGSVRSNLGHPITASGFASLIKVVFALRDGVFPPTLHAEAPVREVGRCGYRLLGRQEPWQGPRRAGINSFGFGGNNAHMIVEAWTPRPVHAPGAALEGEIAVVGLGVLAGEGRSTADFATALAAGLRLGRSGYVSDDPDLLPQQAMMLAAAREALEGVAPWQRAGALVGLQCDAGGWDGAAGAAAYTGRLTNLVANRLNHVFDLRAPSFTLAAEEASGLVGLALAMRALRAGEADLMLVGAVDLAAEPVHEAAARQVLGRERGGDAAVAMALKRLPDALAAGDRVLAVFGQGPGACQADLAPLVGFPHAAIGLLAVAAAVLAGRVEPIQVEVVAMTGAIYRVTVTPS